MDTREYVAKQTQPLDIAKVLHEIRREYSEKYYAQFNLSGDDVVKMRAANARLQACDEVFTEIYERVHKLVLS